MMEVLQFYPSFCGALRPFLSRSRWANYLSSSAAPIRGVLRLFRPDLPRFFPRISLGDGGCKWPRNGLGPVPLAG